jgi:hypothetical protein
MGYTSLRATWLSIRGHGKAVLRHGSSAILEFGKAKTTEEITLEVDIALFDFLYSTGDHPLPNYQVM